MALFPGAVPAAGSAVPTASLQASGHASLHNTHSDETRALAQKLGTGASTPTADKVLTGNGIGTSSWTPVNLTTMVSGVLPIANGGTSATTAADARTALGLNTQLEILAAVYPIGSIYTNANNATNPATLLGFGTWTAFGAGKVMIGLNAADTDFDTAEETGGAKTVAAAAHTHPLSSAGRANIRISSSAPTLIMQRISLGTNFTATHSADITNFASDATSQASGAALSGNTDSATPDATSVVQPYVVVYMWKRTA